MSGSKPRTRSRYPSTGCKSHPLERDPRSGYPSGLSTAATMTARCGQSRNRAWRLGAPASLCRATAILHNRGAQFSLDPKSPNAIEPHKRPYNTLSAGFVMKDGNPLMTLLLNWRGHAVARSGASDGTRAIAGPICSSATVMPRFHHLQQIRQPASAGEQSLRAGRQGLGRHGAPCGLGRGRRGRRLPVDSVVAADGIVIEARLIERERLRYGEVTVAHLEEVRVAGRRRRADPRSCRDSSTSTSDIVLPSSPLRYGIPLADPGRARRANIHVVEHGGLEDSRVLERRAPSERRVFAITEP